MPERPLGLGWIDGWSSPRFRETTYTHLAESAEDIASVALGQADGRFAQAVKTSGQIPHRSPAVAIVLRAPSEQVSAKFLQRSFQLAVPREVKGTEVVDERGQPVQGALVDAVLRSLDGGEDFGGQLRGFLAEGRDAFTDEGVEVATKFARGFIGNAPSILCDFHLLDTLDHLQTDAVGSGHLEHPGLEDEAVRDGACRWKRLLDGVKQAVRALKLKRCSPLLGESTIT